MSHAIHPYMIGSTKTKAQKNEYKTTNRINLGKEMVQVHIISGWKLSIFVLVQFY